MPTLPANWPSISALIRPVAKDGASRTQQILDAAVAGIAGSERPGQDAMASAICHAFDGGEHLLVQAGTGTGKSLGYLAPSLAYLLEHPNGRVIISTATLALQAQLAVADIPAAVRAAEKVAGRTVKHAILKGRTNYACLHRVMEGTGAEQDALLGGADVAQEFRRTGADAASVLGAEVVALREWVREELDSEGDGDRDAAPTHTPAAWAQVSVPGRECLGTLTCPFGDTCFVERSRARAREADLVVTNHALLAIDAMHGNSVLPEHDCLVIDEAHELTDRVTGAASHELSPQQIERVAKRCLPFVEDDLGVEFLDAGETFNDALAEAPLERITDHESPLLAAVARLRDVSRRVVSAANGDEPEQKQVSAAAKEIFDIAEATATLTDNHVVWVSDRERFGRWLVSAPLDVALLLRERVLGSAPTVLTSATLTVGGQFETAASSVGLRRAERLDAGDQSRESGQAWRGIDVGSPFDYSRQGILYIADRLPPPRRDGITPEALKELAELVWAAGGRTLGLFASQRNAEAAARHCRSELPSQTFLCQGDAQLSELTRRFVREPETSLFGTLSLWQGVDVPGDTCRLVVIDKIPFPRPDDPLMQARQNAVSQAGGNGFMSVAASHAALLLAQGSGRLIRRVTDKGVVAVLDSRLKSARYGGFLRASLPPFWNTTDPEIAVSALRRLGTEAG